jgi:hypothetical protein
MRRMTGLPLHARLCVFVLLLSGAALAAGSGAQPTAASRDTVTVLGGPGRWDGRFETATGQPNWHGWTTVDHSVARDTLWQVSTYQAEALGGHGPGNRAMWCGTSFASGEVGYGNDWSPALQWTYVVPDPVDTSTVVVHGYLNHDTEPGFDRVVLRVLRAGGVWQDVQAYEGWRVNREVSASFKVSPEDYAGDLGDEIRLRWAFLSDGLWSDEDGDYPTDGACQLDDLAVVVNGALVTFDDFEAGHGAAWTPFLPGVGSFGHLASGLQDLDPCVQNTSWQVCFVDDGQVVPDTGGSPCVQWCYGPGGYVLNTDGGALGADGRLDNAVVSPPLAWPDGCDQSLVAFDVWRHDLLTGQTPGMVYRWRVRSTAASDPAALADAPWRERGDVGFGPAAYVREEGYLGDLLEPGRRWFQIELEVYEFGWVWGLEGNDPTPAPYFDNVCVQAWPVTAPEIIVREADLPQDTFPASGHLDLVNLGTNSCRFDMARNISPPQHLRNDPGDSIVATIARLRPDGFWAGLPKLVVRLQCNPLFDAYRVVQPPVGQHFVQTVVQGDSCRTPDGKAVPNRWYFDLLDANLIFPGDVLHFYFEAMDFANGQLGIAHWPADTTGFSVFTTAAGYPRAASMHALPTLRTASGEQPEILVWRDFTTGDDPAAWDHALANLGLHEGSEYDLFVTREPDAGLGNGLGGRAAAVQLVGYRSLLYGAGDHVRSTLATGDQRIDASADLAVLSQWCQFGERHLLLTGDNVAWSLVGRGALADQFRAGIMGVSVSGDDVSGLVGGQVSPRVLPIAGNQVIHNVGAWRALGGCPTRRAFDALLPAAGSLRLAEYATPGGVGGAYTAAAAVLHTNDLLQYQTITLPMAFVAIVDQPGENDSGLPIPARARLLGDILVYFGSGTGVPVGVPDAAVLAVRCFPNPFNPAATIAYNLPHAGRASLKVYDLRGRLVRVLLDDVRPAGPGQVVWDGRDGDGAAVASGIYFHELMAGGETRLGKMTLVK